MSNKKLAVIIAACAIAIIAAIVVPKIVPTTYTLSVNINPPQAGSVSPAGGEYESGDQITLTASPAGGYAFVYWGGAASGSSNTVSVTINSDKVVTAYFELDESSPTSKEPAGSLDWHEAKDHIGERVTVCGPVVDTHWASGSTGKPTFLNLGNPYPDLDRFTIVIWVENRDNFAQALEDYYLGKTICVTGLVTEYERVPEVEIRHPSEIQDP